VKADSDSDSDSDTDADTGSSTIQRAAPYLPHRTGPR